MPRRYILIIMLAAAGCVQAEPPEMPPVAAACMGCHGPAGDSRGEIPTLAGLEASEFRQAMQDFKDGDGTIMNRIAPAYSDADIETMAAYFASLAKP